MLWMKHGKLGWGLIQWLVLYPISAICFWWLLRIYKDGHLLTWVLLRLHFSSLELLMKCWLLIIPNIWSFKICLIAQNSWRRKIHKTGVVSKCLFFWVFFNFRKICKLERDCDIVCMVLWEQKLTPSYNDSKYHFNSVWGKSAITPEPVSSTRSVRVLWLLPEHSGSPVYLYFGEQKC